MNHFECVIIGNGVIGLTAALALHQKGIKVAIVAPLNQKQPNNSVCAINQCSKTIWHNLKVWDQLKPHATPIKHMQLNCLGSELTLHAIQHEKNELGWILPNHFTIQVLSHALTSQQIPIIQGPLNNLQHLDSSLQLNISHHEPIHADWALATDGRNSQVKEQLGLHNRCEDYHQTAHCFTIQHSQPHHYIARQNFLNTGPLAALPLGKPNQSCIIWSHTQTLPEKVTPNLEIHFPSLGQTTLTSDITTFPLKGSIIENFYHKRIAFAGDAAHTVHPLAGLGMNLGLIDIAVLHQICHNDPLLFLPEYHKKLHPYQSFMMKSFGLLAQQSIQCPNLISQSFSLTQLRHSFKEFFINQANAKEWTHTPLTQPTN
ncbi:MAG TPA: FAD-dependent monooxygenase [Gammaproteobacteria bacterium]|nr:FAD-dependent monooxygenase [Gammaproteobacteria bacterium]